MVNKDNFYMGLACVLSAGGSQGAVILGLNGAWTGNWNVTLENSVDIRSSATICVLRRSFVETKGSTLFINYFPSREDLIEIIYAGVKRLVYLPVGEKQNLSDLKDISHNLVIEEFRGSVQWLRDYMKEMSGKGLLV